MMNLGEARYYSWGEGRASEGEEGIGFIFHLSFAIFHFPFGLAISREMQTINGKRQMEHGKQLP